MKHRLPKLRLQALARIATMPINILTRRKHHLDPITHTPLQVAEEELQFAADIDAQQIEIGHPYTVPPWRTININRPLSYQFIPKLAGGSGVQSHDSATPVSSASGTLDSFSVPEYAWGAGLQGHCGATYLALNPRTVCVDPGSFRISDFIDIVAGPMLI
jgi:hypothetical protein